MSKYICVLTMIIGISIRYATDNSYIEGRTKSFFLCLFAGVLFGLVSANVLDFVFC